MVKLVLRDKEYEVKPGMTLLSSLEKCGILSESVIATREGELILDDEILKDGEVIRLVAVISGGSISSIHEEHEERGEKIDAPLCLWWVSSQKDGGSGVFRTGCTRPKHPTPRFIEKTPSWRRDREM